MPCEDPIVFENVCKVFGGHEVIAHQTFSIHAGERFVIIGPSGTGKSVSLKLASGQLFPSSGKVKLLGHDLAQLSTKALSRLRKRVGYLFQSGALLGWKTLAENIALPLEERDECAGEELEQRVREALEEVGLGQAGELYPAEASGGMVKRAAFARAMIDNPEVLFCDEPTSGLDPVMSRTIDRLIVDINERRGTTCVVVTHDLAGALLYASRIAFLKAGRFLEVATPDGIRRSKAPEIQAFLKAQQLEVCP